MAAQISKQILNRIAIGNYLLSTAGPLTPNADPLSVAQAVLLAHDAAELVTAALSASLGATFKDKQKTFLPNYVDVIEDKTSVRIRLFFNDLNEARVAFKHFGILPNTNQFHDCVLRTRKYLDEASIACLNMSLEEVGLESLIEDDAARRLYEEAKVHSQQGRFEEAFKSLAVCFNTALDATPFAYDVHVGRADTEAALHLSGCGVDPSTFLALQKFLPTVRGDETSWDLRETGHLGNWTRANVDYCLDVTLKIILQIQHAPFKPHAIPFEYVFEDVLTAKIDGVVVNAEHVINFGRDRPLRWAVGELKKGEQLAGRLTPAYEFDPTSEWTKTSIENANLFVFSPTGGEACGKKIEAYVRLLIRADLVDLSHRVVDSEWVREQFPHLF